MTAGAGLVVALGVALFYGLRADSWLFIDWRSYEFGALRFLAEGSPYAPFQLVAPYGLAATAGENFIYPPTGLLLVLPFAATGPAGVALWLTLGLGLYVGGLVMVARYERAPLSVVTAVVVLSVLTGTLGQAIHNANATLHIAGLLGIAYGWRAGAIGGIVGALKLSPIAVGALDGWRGLVTAGVIAAVLALVTLPLVGVGMWADYVTVLANGRPSCQWFTSVACAWGTPVAFATMGLFTFGAVVARSRFVRLVLVTGALLAGATELVSLVLLYPIPHFFLYVTPALVVVVGKFLRR